MNRDKQNSLIQIYAENKAFLLPYIVIWVISLAFAIVFGREQSQIFINRLNSQFLDQFFKYVTYLGSGYFFVLVIFLVAIFRGKASGGLIVAAILSTIFVQAFKHTIGGYRPYAFFEMYSDYSLHLVSGVKMLRMHSFPSGHTATAFAVFFYLAALTRKNWLKVSYLLLAVLVAYSRVYLSQHFVIDVVGGSFIGVLSSYVGLWWYYVVQKIRYETVV